MSAHNEAERPRMKLAIVICSNDAETVAPFGSDLVSCIVGRGLKLRSLAYNQYPADQKAFGVRFPFASKPKRFPFALYNCSKRSPRLSNLIKNYLSLTYYA